MTYNLTADSDNEGEGVEEAQKLPPANIANLNQILETVLATDTTPKKERFAKAVIDEVHQWQHFMYLFILTGLHTQIAGFVQYVRVYGGARSSAYYVQYL